MQPPRMIDMNSGHNMTHTKDPKRCTRDPLRAQSWLEMPEKVTKQMVTLDFVQALIHGLYAEFETKWLAFQFCARSGPILGAICV